MVFDRRGKLVEVGGFAFSARAKPYTLFLGGGNLNEYSHTISDSLGHDLVLVDLTDESVAKLFGANFAWDQRFLNNRCGRHSDFPLGGGSFKATRIELGFDFEEAG